MYLVASWHRCLTNIAVAFVNIAELLQTNMADKIQYDYGYSDMNSHILVYFSTNFSLLVLRINPIDDLEMNSITTPRIHLITYHSSLNKAMFVYKANLLSVRERLGLPTRVSLLLESILWWNYRVLTLINF